MADDIYNNDELSDLEIVRGKRLLLIEGLSGDNGVPCDEHLDAYLRVLKDTGTAATNGAKMRMSKGNNDAADEHSLILRQLLDHITPGGANEDNPAEVNPEDFVLPEEHESDELVPGEDAATNDLGDITQDP